MVNTTQLFQVWKCAVFLEISFVPRTCGLLRRRLDTPHGEDVCHVGLFFENLLKLLKLSLGRLHVIGDVGDGEAGLVANKLIVCFPYQTQLYGIITQTLFKVLSVWNVDHCTYYNLCARVQLIVQYAHHRAPNIFLLFSEHCMIMQFCTPPKQTTNHTSPPLVE